MKKRQSVLGTLTFAVVFFMAGLLAYQHLTKPIAKEAEASKEWATTMGIVTMSKISSTRDSDGKTMYSANVEYVYSVGDKEFNGVRIRTVDGSTSLKSSVEKVLRKFPKGAKVEVHYNPESPDTAVLKPGTGFVLGIILKLPLFFCIVSVLMVLNLFKRIMFGR
uniref:DUF3592 domain-containing protein n=1 Tax=uncultured Draconibacterium sp. TaxID=1573823 RepID=UPI0032177050